MIAWGTPLSSLWAPLLLSLAILCLAIGSVHFYLGTHQLRKVFAPLFVLVVAVPQLSMLLEAASLPLRLISTQLSSSMLNLIGFSTQHFGTELWIGGDRIAVTDACSGTTSLASLLWLGWIFVLRQQPPGISRAIAYTFLLPASIGNRRQHPSNFAARDCYEDLWPGNPEHPVSPLRWLGNRCHLHGHILLPGRNLRFVLDKKFGSLQFFQQMIDRDP